ncbi:MAG: P-loop NTPase fold protein, partial [Vibrio splendidus]
GDGMSKAAGQLIAAQMATEKVRKVELPHQLAALHTALVQNAQGERVVVIVDELDRCHPDYAIAFLEAMKLIFSQSGFVFCLMVNADYLERLAKHRFGASTKEEKYLDKFVDIRLTLAPKGDTFKQAVYELTQQLPNEIPYGDGIEFSIEHAAELASKLAVRTKFSMRKVKRLLLKVEVALRCYSDRPLDVSLLIYLAFKHEAEEIVTTDDLPRAFFTPQQAEKLLYVPESSYTLREEAKRDRELNMVVSKHAPELLNLPAERYQYPDEKNYKDWAKVLDFLAPHYIPSHEAALNAVATVLASDN